MSGELVRYEAARQALAECVRVDEAKGIRDKAAALAAYARQRDDKEMQVWAKEIYYRACQRIGVLSRELETAQGTRTDLEPHDTSDVRLKTAALADAGIGIRTAQRYEELAGGRTEQGQRAAEAAADLYFTRSRDDGEPASMEGLRGAIREALVETLGEPPTRGKLVSFRSKPDPVALAETDMGTAIHTIAELSEPDMEKVASKVHAALLGWHLDRARYALARLTSFVSALSGRCNDAAE